MRAATESFDFVAEHLAEAAMDNRYASLPVWGTTVQGGYMSVETGGLKLDGPTVSFAAGRALSRRWSVTALAVFDALSFAGERDQRPLEPLFSKSIPLSLPADARFTGLDGAARDIAAGFSLARRADGGRLGERLWVAGVLWQQLQLRDYRMTYTLTSGPDAGATGTIDYSADYTHVVPFAGFGMTLHAGRWSYSPHALAAVPLPRRGVEGCLSAAGSVYCGDTAAAGNGKHFGDPYLALGLALGYEPWGLTVDLGGTLVQALAEPFVHRGIDRNLMLSLEWRR